MNRAKTPSFARALRAVRIARGMSQESFDQVSSRTYVSTLERGLKQPTLSKVDSLAEALEVHPLTLLVVTYSPSMSLKAARGLWARVERELCELESREDA